MAWTEVDTDSGDVTLDTPLTLTTQTTAGIHVCEIDLSQMVAGDIIIVTIKTKVTSSGSATVLYQRTFAHAQIDKVLQLAFQTQHYYELIIEQTDGTARDFATSVRRL